MDVALKVYCCLVRWRSQFEKRFPLQKVNVRRTDVKKSVVWETSNEIVDDENEDGDDERFILINVGGLRSMGIRGEVMVVAFVTI